MEHLASIARPSAFRTLAVVAVLALAASVTLVGDVTATPAQGGMIAVEPSAELRHMVAGGVVTAGEFLDAAASSEIRYEGDQVIEVRSIVLVYRNGELVNRSMGNEAIALEPGQTRIPPTNWFPADFFSPEDLFEQIAPTLAPDDFYDAAPLRVPSTDWSPPASAVGLAQAEAGLVVAMKVDGMPGSAMMKPLVVLFRSAS